MTTRAISFTISYQKHRNMTYECRGNFLYISSSKSLKYSLWLLGLISLSKSSKYDLWLLGAISFTVPHQNHWNMTFQCEGQFPLQLPIKIIRLLGAFSFTIPYQNHRNMTCDCWGHFLYNSLSKSSKYDLWLLWAISFTIPYQNHWNMTYEC